MEPSRGYWESRWREEKARNDALMETLARVINELEHSGYEFDHPSLVEKRAVLAAVGGSRE